jgi:hypothetical protein
MPLVGFEASVRAGEDGSCLRPRGHCDRPILHLHGNITQNASPFLSICLTSAVIVFNVRWASGNEMIGGDERQLLPENGEGIVSPAFTPVGGPASYTCSYSQKKRNHYWKQWNVEIIKLTCFATRGEWARFLYRDTKAQVHSSTLAGQDNCCFEMLNSFIYEFRGLPIGVERVKFLRTYGGERGHCLFWYVCLSSVFIPVAAA